MTLPLSSSGLSVPSPAPAEVARFQVLYQTETGNTLSSEEALAQLTGLLYASVVLLHIPNLQAVPNAQADNGPATPGLDSQTPPLLDSTAH